jgi:ArsR family transcriptional regulator, arsenate/arsenite/antimonite-responsive transcriptional repressor
MESVLAITRALADENRVRALLVLDGRELCVCQLIEFLELAPSTVSKHMTILRQARLIDGRKKGRWMNYRLAGKLASPAVTEAIAWLRRSLSDDPAARRDARRMEKILKTGREVLCDRQSARRKSNPIYSTAA